MANLNSDIIEIINNKFIISSMNDIFINLNKKKLMRQLKEVCYEIKNNNVIYWEEEDLGCLYCNNYVKTRTWGNNDGFYVCLNCSVNHMIHGGEYM